MPTPGVRKLGFTVMTSTLSLPLCAIRGFVAVACCVTTSVSAPIATLPSIVRVESPGCWTTIQSAVVRTRKGASHVPTFFTMTTPLVAAPLLVTLSESDVGPLYWSFGSPRNFEINPALTAGVLSRWVVTPRSGSVVG